MPRNDPEATALFRYRVIAEALNPRLRPLDRGLVVRALAGRLHALPDGTQVQLSRSTLDRWLRAFQEQGLPGLHPQPRCDRGGVRQHPELFLEACELRREVP